MLGIFLDQETTGLDCYKHRLLEIALKIVDLNTGRMIYSYEAIVKQSWSVWEKKDPASISINGFQWEELLEAKEEELIAAEIQELFIRAGIVRHKALFICQNPSFDRAFFAQLVDTYTQEKLLWPYHWLDLASMYWIEQVKKQMQHHQALPSKLEVSKDKIAASYRLPPEELPHRAMHGVDHLLLCYQHVVGFPSAFLSNVSSI